MRPIESGALRLESATDAPPNPRSARARALWIALGCVALLVLGVWLALREPIERGFLTSALQKATGYDVAIGHVRHEGSQTILERVEIRSRQGTFVATLPQVAVARDGATASVDLPAPNIALLPERWRDRPGRRIAAALAAMQVTQLDLHVHGGVITFDAGTVPAPGARLEDVRGDLHFASDGLAYQLTADLLDGTQRYPLSAGATASAGALKAAALPLAPLGRLALGVPVHPSAGVLQDVNLHWEHGAAPRLDARVEGATLELEGGHRLSGLHGAMSLAAGALASPKLAGRFDALPFEYAGEVHDLGSGPHWLWDGSPQLRALDRLTLAIGREPQVQSLRVESTAPGLCYGEYALTSEHGPLAVSVLAIDPHEPSLHFDTAIAGDSIVSGGERTSAMGVRTHAVAGVNGDYFDIGRSYQPQGMLIRNGTLLRGPTDRYALTIDHTGHVEFSEYHIRGEALDGARRFPVTQLNNWPAGEVTVITKAFGKTLPPAEGVTFEALRALDARRGRYVVERVTKMTAAQPVAFGLAFGPLLHGTLPRAGDHIALTYALDPPARDAVAGIGGGPRLLKDNAWYEDPHAPAPDERDVRWPVIALGRLPDDTLLMVAVDGRHPERSIGMTRPEFGELLQRLGASDAMALDSGGSVTLVARAPGDANVSVRNHPSDDSSERWVSDGLFLYSSAALPTLLAPQAATTPAPEARPSP